MPTETDIYRQLQRHIDHDMPVAFPETKSGVEISLLKRLFTPEEARIGLELSTLPEPVEQIHERLKKTGITKEELREKLDGLIKKGSITFIKKHTDEGDVIKYGKVHFAVGMFEFQVNRLTKEFMEEKEQFMDEGFGESFFTKKTAQFRPVPVGKSIKSEHHIATYDNIRDLIQNSAGPFAAMNCVCRQGQEILDNKCKKTDLKEACLTLESAALHMMHLDAAHEVSKEEMLQIIERAEDAGFVLQAENCQRPLFICCCCGCCCGILKVAKKFPKPAEYFNSNYYAVSVPDSCTGCEECIEMCQMDAITMQNNSSHIDLDRCIGCGLCVPVCEFDAINLVPKEKHIIPQQDQNSMYQKIISERVGLLGVVKILAKAVLDMKI